MPETAYEIRLCRSCGLRYPLTPNHPFGTRCPACMGETRVVLRRELVAEPAADTRRESKSGKMKEERGSKEERGKNIAVLLDNIRSAWNVGSILRSADGFGFAHVYLCGITPKADNEAVTKTALGAQNSVPWSFHKDAVKLVKGLKAESWKVYALEEDPRSLPITQLPNSPFTSSQFTHHPIPQSLDLALLILGNEVTGVDPGLLDLCDQIFYIPMRGEKKSFNVAIAFSIAAYALSTQPSGI